MPRRSKTGKFIFSASEVAEFTVCPEAWFLGRMSKKSVNNQSTSSKIEEGERLHKEWAEDYAEGLSLVRGLRIVTALLITATMIMILQSQ